MKNKSLILVALIGLVGFGSSAYFYKNYLKPIYVTESVAGEIKVAAGMVETCSRLGFISKTEENDLDNIVSRLKFKDSNNFEQTVDMDDFNKKTDEITDSFIKDEKMNIMSPFSVGHNLMKVTCESKNEVAKNMKNQYN